MNVVRVWGGLGNQMFQYAFGRALANHTGEETRYDLSWFSRASSDRAYGLGAFACEVPTFSGVRARRLSRDNWFLRLLGIRPSLARLREEPANVFDRRLLDARNAYLMGDFQVAAYYEPIREELRKCFAWRNLPAAVRRRGDELAEKDTISVHVRRGDYLMQQQVYGVCDQSYWTRGVEAIAEKTAASNVVVFSDDISWCRWNLKLPGTVTFEDSGDPTHPEYDLYLMSCCRHNVIANSSFSWWAAWLNASPAKAVVAPSRWFADGRPTEVVPDGWIRL